MNNPNAADYESLQTLLAKRLAELRPLIADEVATEASERYRDLAGEVTDSADAAVAAELAGTENVLIGKHVQEVRDIEAALKRMESGTYGTCIECGMPIELARLKAYPTCKRCTPCQRAYEKTHAGGAHPTL
jgi:RNA polymerase-binding transcription factor DksA